VISHRLWQRLYGGDPAAVLTIALGIGANTSIFSLVYGVLLRPLPYDQPDRIVRIWRAMPTLPDVLGPVTGADFERIRGIDLLESAAAYEVEEVDVARAAEGAPQRISYARATPALLDVLGLRPLRGRWLEPTDSAEPGARPAVISHRLWQRLYGGDPAAVGATLLVDGTPARIVGVMPAGFEFPTDVDLWVPRPELSLESLGMSFASINLVGRLADGAGVEALRQALQSPAGPRTLQMQGRELRDADAAMEFRAETLLDSVVRDARRPLTAFTLAVGLVLLIACANVAHLLLARSTARSRELAVRTALGASRGRLIRQHLTESLLLALVAGALGTALAVACTRVLLTFNPGNIPRVEEIRLDLPVLAFTALLTLATGLLFGLAPALRASSTRPNEALSEHGPGDRAARSVLGRWAGELLAAGEVAMAMMLLVSAGLLLNSFLRMVMVDLGFDSSRLLVATVMAREDANATVANNLLPELLDEARAVPGVRAVSTASTAPPEGTLFDVELAIEGSAMGRPEERPRAAIIDVGDGYFGAMGIPLLAGRDFSAAEVRSEASLAVISERLARAHFPADGAVGRRFFAAGTLWEVVGVAGDARQGDPREAEVPAVYRPRAHAVTEISMGEMHMRQISPVNVIARIDGAPGATIELLRQRLMAHGDLFRLESLERVDTRVWGRLAQPRFYSGVFAAVAAVALLLATIGIYGVLSYAVTRRTHDVGVRMTLGASAGDVLRLVMRRGVAVTALGVAGGLAGSLALTRSLASLLYGVPATDPLTYAAVAALVSAVALLACWLPARRAVRIDPVEALRCR